MARFTRARSMIGYDQGQGLEQAGPQPGQANLGQAKVKHRQPMQGQGPAGPVTSEAQPCRGQTRIEPGPVTSGQVRSGSGWARASLPWQAQSWSAWASWSQWSRPDLEGPGSSRSRASQIQKGPAKANQSLPGPAPGRPRQVWALPDLDLFRQKPGPCHARSGHSQAVQKRAYS